jgi:hypothetical protein
MTNQNISLIIMSVLGILIIAFTSYYSSFLPNNCDSKIVNIGLNSILSIGIIMFLIPVIQITCKQSCNCNLFDLSYDYILITFLITIVSISIMVLVSLKNKCDSDNVKKLLIAYITTCSIFVISSGIYSIFPTLQGSYKVYKNIM